MSNPAKIPEKDIKMLWGLAAGRCSYPQCQTECIDFVNDTPFVIGEMAHIIAKSPSSARGIPSGGNNTYDNLILLCPTHHTLVDKAPEGKYSAGELFEWKNNHEANVKRSLESPLFKNTEEVFRYIGKLLIENKSIWFRYGPESIEANSNPFSSLARIWVLRKQDTIVPNNEKIVNCIYANKSLLDNKEYRIACEFIEHAVGFKIRCRRPVEGIPRFPKKFEKLVIGYTSHE